VVGRTADKQRVEKLPGDAQIKLSVAASDIFGVSGRDMLAALVAGERDPRVLARMARTRLRAKTARLEEAFCGRFSDHHAFLLATMLGRVDQASATSPRWRPTSRPRSLLFKRRPTSWMRSPASAAPPRR
jgi:transposase